MLVLDAGSLLVTEHVQNLGRIGLNVPAPIPPAGDPGVARDVVWGLPWRGNVDFPGLARCVGGKSVYWGGWCPRLTPADLARWPASVAGDLSANYTDVESETGVVPGTDFIFGALHDTIATAVMGAAPACRTARSLPPSQQRVRLRPVSVPTVGSVNPVLTWLTLAKRVAEHATVRTG